MLSSITLASQSQATRLIAQQVVEVNIKVNVKDQHYWPLRRMQWSMPPSQMLVMRKECLCHDAIMGVPHPERSRHRRVYLLQSMHNRQPIARPWVWGVIIQNFIRALLMLDNSPQTFIIMMTICTKLTPYTRLSYFSRRQQRNAIYSTKISILYHSTFIILQRYDLFSHIFGNNINTRNQMITYFFYFDYQP